MQPGAQPNSKLSQTFAKFHEIQNFREPHLKISQNFTQNFIRIVTRKIHNKIREILGRAYIVGSRHGGVVSESFPDFDLNLRNAAKAAKVLSHRLGPLRELRLRKTCTSIKLV